MQMTAIRERVERLKWRVIAAIVVVNSIVEAILICDVIWNRSNLSLAIALALPVWVVLSIFQTNRQLQPHTDLRGTLRILNRTKKRRRQSLDKKIESRSDDDDE